MRRIALLLLLVLSSCALTAPGKGEFTPLEPDAASANLVRVPGPGLWFIRANVITTFPANAFGQVSDGVLFLPKFELDTVLRKTVNWAKPSNTNVPKGWELELVRQEASRKVIEVVGKTGRNEYQLSTSCLSLTALSSNLNRPTGVRTTYLTRNSGVLRFLAEHKNAVGRYLRPERNPCLNAWVLIAARNSGCISQRMVVAKSCRWHRGCFGNPR
jgi:hypothetical protein